MTVKAGVFDLETTKICTVGSTPVPGLGNNTLERPRASLMDLLKGTMIIALGGLIKRLKPATFGLLALSLPILPLSSETTHSYQEPVDVHEKQSKQECVEEEVERDVGN